MFPARFHDVLSPGSAGGAVLQQRLASPAIRAMVIVTKAGGERLYDAALAVAQGHQGMRWVVWAQDPREVASILDAIERGLGRRPGVLAAAVDCWNLQLRALITEVTPGEERRVMDTAFRAAERMRP